MKKTYIMLCVLIFMNADAQVLVALLKSVENNHTLHMRYQQQPFVCTPYGVETVSQLLLKTDLNSSCMQAINDFRASHPEEKFFAISTLYIEQQYSVEGLEEACLLHLSSSHSYSETLLEKGYARISALLQFKEFELYERFEQAQLRAKKKNEGIWSDGKVQGCF